MNPPLMHFFYALNAPLFIVSIMMVLERRLLHILYTIIIYNFFKKVYKYIKTQTNVCILLTKQN